MHRIAWHEAPAWNVCDEGIRHRAGRFFSIVGVNVGRREHLLIDQPEVGILGFVVAFHEGETHWLVQYKAEPGNVGLTQGAPTVQATRSNYERVHGGRPTPLLETFRRTSRRSGDVVASEQGDRFLDKFNRNATRVLRHPPPLPSESDRYAWRARGDLKSDLSRDFALNTDARSVLVSGPWDLLLGERSACFGGAPCAVHVQAALRASLTTLSPRRVRTVRRALRLLARDRSAPRTAVPVDRWEHHRLVEDGVVSAEGERVVGVFDCIMPSREVTRWQQPLVEQASDARLVLLLRVVDGVAMFGLTAYEEPGHVNRVELGPTLQTGDGRGKRSSAAVDALVGSRDVLARVRQSDEGGRFWRSVGVYEVVVWEGAVDAFDADTTFWLTLGEIEQLVHASGFVTNELRTCLSLVLAIT